MVDAVFKDWRTAPVREETRAMLGFLEALTVRPEALGPEDALALRKAGVSRAAADNAVMVAVLFGVINRIADGLGFEIPSDAALGKAASMLLKRGYA